MIGNSSNLFDWFVARLGNYLHHDISIGNWLLLNKKIPRSLPLIISQCPVMLFALLNLAGI